MTYGYDKTIWLIVLIQMALGKKNRWSRRMHYLLSQTKQMTNGPYEKETLWIDNGNLFNHGKWFIYSWMTLVDDDDDDDDRMT